MGEYYTKNAIDELGFNEVEVTVFNDSENVKAYVNLSVCMFDRRKSFAYKIDIIVDCNNENEYAEYKENLKEKYITKQDDEYAEKYRIYSEHMTGEITMHKFFNTDEEIKEYNEIKTDIENAVTLESVECIRDIIINNVVMDYVGLSNMLRNKELKIKEKCTEAQENAQEEENDGIKTTAMLLVNLVALGMDKEDALQFINSDLDERFEERQSLITEEFLENSVYNELMVTAVCNDYFDLDLETNDYAVTLGEDFNYLKSLEIFNKDGDWITTYYPESVEEFVKHLEDLADDAIFKEKAWYEYNN